MPTDAEYESMIQHLDNWKKLRDFWGKIQKADTPGWAVGKAFEYLVLQAFNAPQAILLWTGREIEQALDDNKMLEHLEYRYRTCVETGIPDASIQKSGAPTPPPTP